MEPFMSLICLWGPTWAPRSWALCQGQLMSIDQNQALFSLLGTVYGGDGRTTFQLPDLRGRVPVGPGRGNGLSYDYRQGEMLGTESVTLTVLQMPSHNHTAQLTVNSSSASVKASPVVATEGIPGTNSATTLAATKDARSDGPNIYNAETPTVELNTASEVAIDATVSVDNNGGNQSFNIVQPVQAVNYIIALQGIYPSRN